jgi:hypothetical protein
MMKLSREEIMTALEEWNHAWENHDLDGVMKLNIKISYIILFEHNFSAEKT